MLIFDQGCFNTKIDENGKKTDEGYDNKHIKENGSMSSGFFQLINRGNCTLWSEFFKQMIDENDNTWSGSFNWIISDLEYVIKQTVEMLKSFLTSLSKQIENIINILSRVCHQADRGNAYVFSIRSLSKQIDKMIMSYLGRGVGGGGGGVFKCGGNAIIS